MLYTLCCYFRLLVSGHLQKEQEFFQYFIEGGKTVKEFCNQVLCSLYVFESLENRKQLIFVIFPTTLSHCNNTAYQ